MEKKKLIYTKDSLLDLKEIRDFIQSNSENKASFFVDELKEKIKVLISFPNFGFEISKNKRKLVLHKNYYVLYEMRGDMIYIVSIRHSKLS